MRVKSRYGFYIGTCFSQQYFRKVDIFLPYKMSIIKLIILYFIRLYVYINKISISGEYRTECYVESGYCRYLGTYLYTIKVPISNYHGKCHRFQIQYSAGM